MMGFDGVISFGFGFGIWDASGPSCLGRARRPFPYSPSLRLGHSCTTERMRDSRLRALRDYRLRALRDDRLLTLLSHTFQVFLDVVWWFDFFWFRVRVSGCGIRVADRPGNWTGLAGPLLRIENITTSPTCVLGFGYPVSNFGTRISGFEYRDWGFGNITTCPTWNLELTVVGCR